MRSCQLRAGVSLTSFSQGAFENRTVRCRAKCLLVHWSQALEMSLVLCQYAPIRA